MLGCIHLMLQQACFHSTEKKNQTLFCLGWRFSIRTNAGDIDVQETSCSKSGGMDVILLQVMSWQKNVSAQVIFSTALEVMCKDLSRPRIRGQAVSVLC